MINLIEATVTLQVIEVSSYMCISPTTSFRRKPKLNLQKVKMMKRK